LKYNKKAKGTGIVEFAKFNSAISLEWPLDIASNRCFIEEHNHSLFSCLLNLKVHTSCLRWLIPFLKFCVWEFGARLLPFCCTYSRSNCLSTKFYLILRRPVRFWMHCNGL